MSGFLYFFTGPKVKNAPDFKRLKELQLDHLVGVAVSQAGWAGNEVMLGPGVICAIADSELSDGGCEPRVGYYPDTQEWRKGGDGWWIGWEKDNPSGAVDLARLELRWGHKVQMGNGEVFVVPPERYLPDRLELNENDECDRVPLDEFVGIRKLTVKLRADFYTQIGKLARKEEEKEEKEKVNLIPPMTEGEQLKTGNFFLGLNYRIGRVEANVLELWNDQSLREALEAVLDWPTEVKMIKEMMKDKDKKKSLKADADISAVEGGGVS